MSDTVHIREPKETTAAWLELTTGGKVKRCAVPSIHDRTLRNYRQALRAFVKPNADYSIYLHIRSKANTENDTDNENSVGR